MTDNLKSLAATETATLMAELNEALITLAEIRRRVARYDVCATLDEARKTLAAGRLPAWPTAPTSIQMQRRNDATTEYMYLYWPSDRRTGEYKGPANKTGKPARKTYIGARRDNQQLAKSMIVHEQQYLELRREARSLADRLTTCCHGISGIHAQIGQANLSTIKRFNLGGVHEPLSAFHN